MRIRCPKSRSPSRRKGGEVDLLCAGPLIRSYSPEQRRTGDWTPGREVIYSKERIQQLSAKQWRRRAGRVDRLQSGPIEEQIVHKVRNVETEWPTARRRVRPLRT